ncbi:MAG TPA: hypothetical protein VKW78_06665 [Terriglobales bacterium]|nr:hypothetical protein [Terriglobales bacterium]
MASVDVDTLLGRHEAREFFHPFLANVINDSNGCGAGVAPPRRAVIIVSDSMVFPGGRDKEPLSLPEQSSIRFFQVRFSYTEFATPFYSGRNKLGGVVAGMYNSTTFDEVAHMLGELHPRHFDVTEPRELRHAAAEIIKEIELSSSISDAR